MKPKDINPHFYEETIVIHMDSLEKLSGSNSLAAIYVIDFIDITYVGLLWNGAGQPKTSPVVRQKDGMHQKEVIK